MNHFSLLYLVEDPFIALQIVFTDEKDTKNKHYVR